MKCPVCLSGLLSRNYAFRSHDLLQCSYCGTLIERVKPTELEINDCYEIYDYKERRKISIPTQYSYKRLLEYLEDCCNGAASVLDIGCGQGDFLLAAKSRGWQVKGLEYSNSAIDLCVFAGLDVSAISTLYSLPISTYSVVTLFEVLEHLIEPDPLLNRISQILSKDGLLYITTPNARSLLRFLEGDSFSMLRYPEHLTLYTVLGLTMFLEAHGFKVRSAKTTGINISNLLKASVEKFSYFARSASLKKISANTSFLPSDMPQWQYEHASFNEKLRLLAATGIGFWIKNFINSFLTLGRLGDTIIITAVKN